MEPNCLIRIITTVDKLIYCYMSAYVFCTTLLLMYDILSEENLTNQ